MKLDLKRVYEIMNKLSSKQEEMWEQDKYIHLMGARSEYSETSFESFLGYYSFKVEDENIVVFNNDGIPYEDWNNNDFSYIPLFLLDLSDEDLEKWIDLEIGMKLAELEMQKVQEKDDIKRQIELLTKRLEE